MTEFEWALIAIVLGPLALGAARKSGWSYAKGYWENYLEYIISIILFAVTIFAVTQFVGIFE